MKCNLLVYGFHAPELSPAVLAAARGQASIAYWIGVPREGMKFDADIIQWHLGQEVFPVGKDWRLPINEETRGIVQQHSRQIRDQLRRNPGCSQFSELELDHYAAALYEHFKTLLHERQIDLLVFQNLPHEGFELMLYLAAKSLRLRTLLCYQSILENRFFYCEDLLDFGFFSECEALPPEPFDCPRQFRKSLFYMADTTSSEPATVTPFGSNSPTVQLQRAGGWSRPFRFLRTWWRLRALPKPSDPAAEYRNNLDGHTSQDYSMLQPFVYFPLHLQPELTTSAIGDEYVDQLLALEQLAEWLPPTVSILVKENPKQDHRWRPPVFFQRLRQIPRVVMVPQSVSTYELLERCLFAATITGTVGWEAITGGKAVLAFGRPWYLTLPGVYYFRDGPEYSTVVNTVIDHHDLCQKTSELLRKSRKGIVDVNYRRGFAGFNSETNATWISDFLRHEIGKTRVATDSI